MKALDKKQWDELLALAQNGDGKSQYEVGFYFENGIINPQLHKSVMEKLQ